MSGCIVDPMCDTIRCWRILIQTLLGEQLRLLCCAATHQHQNHSRAMRSLYRSTTAIVLSSTRPAATSADVAYTRVGEVEQVSAVEREGQHLARQRTDNEMGCSSC